MEHRMTIAEVNPKRRGPEKPPGPEGLVPMQTAWACKHEAPPAGEACTIRVLLFLLGISAFPITESLLLQTATFTECFDLGRAFYGIATLVLFLPGLVIQVRTAVSTEHSCVHPHSFSGAPD